MGTPQPAPRRCGPAPAPRVWAEGWKQHVSPLARCSASMTTRRETEARGRNQAERETFIYQGKGAFPPATQGNHPPSPKHLPASEGFGGSPAPRCQGSSLPKWWERDGDTPGGGVGGVICHYPRFHPPHREQAGSPLGKAAPPPPQGDVPCQPVTPQGWGKPMAAPLPMVCQTHPSTCCLLPRGQAGIRQLFFKAEGKYPPWG